jgi:HlyD family secretion protein
MKTFAAFLLLVGLAGGGGYYYVQNYMAEPPASFRTATLRRGDLLATISATGTVQPEEVVDVGAQVAGRIIKLLVDYGSVVKKDTILAQIDESVYKAQRDQATASLMRAKADLKQSQAKLDLAREERRRAESLRPQRAIAETDYILAVSNDKSAVANVALCEAVIKQAEAALELAETNLGYTVIKSPVDGVIIARRVNVGQTVVASLNAPSLFLIAKDLRKMQIWAQVNEADIGRIKPGQAVRFTVDAFPREQFRGQVGQVRLNAQSTQNVVTYTVVVLTDNSDLRLLPYLTANLQFEVESRTGVLQAPNAALRWRPRAELIVPEARQAATPRPSAGWSKAGGGPPEGAAGGGRASGERRGGAGDRSATRHADRGRVWQIEGNLLRPVDVEVGLSDGSFTEIRSPELKEDMELAIGEARNDQPAGGETTNPFAPKLFRRSGGAPKGPQ